MSRRRGFSLIELLVVFVVLGILAGIAVLRYVDLRNHAEVSAIIGDLGAIRVGAYNYWADKDKFPPDAGAGVVPAGMAPYLNGGFSFTRAKYTLDWENFQGGTGAGGMQVGVMVTSPDSRLMALLARRAAGGLPYFVAGNTVAFIIVGPDGRM
jgi:prepilin-type N-terminal cleavage/methylation domain-containing protein